MKVKISSLISQKQEDYSRKFIRKLTLDYRVMKCKECGTGLRRYDDRGLKTALKEYVNLFAKSGFIKGGYITENKRRSRVCLWE